LEKRNATRAFGYAFFNRRMISGARSSAGLVLVSFLSVFVPRAGAGIISP
jgi:hypothetical protein